MYYKKFPQFLQSSQLYFVNNYNPIKLFGIIAYCTPVYMILKWKLYRKSMKMINYSRALKVCINIYQNIPSLHIMQPGLKFNILGKAPNMQICFHFFF